MRRAMTPAYRAFMKTAIENFEKAVTFAPDYVDYTNLGWAYYNVAQQNLRDRSEAEYKTNLGKARDAFVRANSLKPVSKVAAAINLNLGMTLTDLGDYANSITALKAAIEIEKNWIPAINELGIAYRKNGDLENAVKQFKRAVDIDDKFAVAHYNLAEAEYRRNNLKEAKKGYDKLKAMNRTDLVNQLVFATNGGILKDAKNN
jgi:tetratricopeptide (TPR) repeat protein